MPILEPEVNITIDDKAEAEVILRDELIKNLDALDTPVMLKLSLAVRSQFLRTADCAYERACGSWHCRADTAATTPNRMLAENTGMIASFSRALTEGLNDAQSDDEFNAMIAETIEAIYRASVT